MKKKLSILLNKSKRSKIWDHFAVSQDNMEVKCDHCPLVLKKHATTTNLWTHLAVAHKITQEKEEKESSSVSHPAQKKVVQQSIQASVAKMKKDPLNMVLARLCRTTKTKTKTTETERRSNLYEFD